MDFAPPRPNRDHSITFRVTASELLFLDRLADEHGMTRSEVVRGIFAGRIDTSDRPVPSGETTDIELS